MKKSSIISLLIIILFSQLTWAGPFSPDGNLYVEKTAEELKVWNLLTGETVHAMDITFPYVLNKNMHMADLTKDYVIKAVSYTGRYVVVAGFEGFKTFKTSTSGRATIYIDMQERKVLFARVEDSKYTHKELIMASPNSNQYVFCDASNIKDKYYTNISFRSFDTDESSSLSIKGDPEVKGYDNVIGFGRIIERNNQLYYAVSYTNGTKLYDLNNLAEGKPIKLKVKKSNLSFISHDFTICYDSHKRVLLENGKGMKTASNFDKNSSDYTSMFVKDQPLIVQWKSVTNEVRLFDYRANSYTPLKKLYEEEHEWVKFSSNNRLLIIQFKSGRRVYDLVSGQLVSELK